MKAIEHVAKEIGTQLYGFVDKETTPVNWLRCMDYAEVALIAMRNLVKFSPNGTMADDVIVNKYIDEALKDVLPTNLARTKP